MSISEPLNPIAEPLKIPSMTGMVVYKSKMSHCKIKGGKKNFAIYTAEEFIASITQHIEKPVIRKILDYLSLWREEG